MHNFIYIVALSLQRISTGQPRLLDYFDAAPTKNAFFAIADYTLEKKMNVVFWRWANIKIYFRF